MSTFQEFLSSLDPDSGKRGKQFEYFVKWFLKTDPQWSSQVDQVWLWDEYPDNWGRDCGIDLVFRHKNGENWAVQAKCYAPSTSITKADVDSFISESNRDLINKRLLIATTDLIGANAKQVCDAQDKKVVRFLLSNFEDADIEYPPSIEDLPKAKPKDKPQPREHQKEAIEAVASKFNDTDRGQLIMACGTGKTFTTLWIKEKLQAESTLVLLPSLGLLSQTLHEWTMATNELFEVLCVCSDESVGKKGNDESVHSIADLAFPVTSEVEDIKVFLNHSGKKVIFSTYQSSPLIADAQSDRAVPVFDLAIADEAHRCAGKVSGDFSTILDGEKIRAKKRLFTTATPRTYSSSVKKAAEDRGVEVVGMDDEAVFGKQLFALNFGEAIKRGLLTDYRVVIIGVDDPTISALIENRELLKADSDIEMDAESLAAQVGLLKAIKDYDLHRLISFHSRVSRAEDFSQDIHKVLGWIDEKHKPSGELKSDFVSGEMPTDKRRRKLSQLKSLKEGERGLLTNARCLSEGVDVPSLDGVAFIDPRSSQIDIIQAVGRAIRLSENKKAGTIVLPVFIANSDDPERALEEGNFKPIWDVLNALKSHDDVLADELNQIRTELGRKGGGKVDPNAFSKITIDFPITVDQSFGDSLTTLLLENSTSSWNFWYGLLSEYIAQNKNCSPSRELLIFGKYKLANWIGEQRANRWVMPETRRAVLDKTEYWSWTPHYDIWNSNYELLKVAVDESGDIAYTRSFKTSNGVSLSSWILNQRQTKDSLSEERYRKLESLPYWRWDANEYAWDKGFSQLKKYRATNDDCLVPDKFIDEDGFRLGQWVSMQRGKNNKNDLAMDKVIALESIVGWTWDPIETSWQDTYKALVNYVGEKGFDAISQKIITNDGIKIGTWIGTQRANREKLPQNKIAALEAIPGWKWSGVEDLWSLRFAELQSYSKNNDVSKIPFKFISQSGFKLGSWVTTQRASKHSLSPEKIKKLESISGWVWNSLDGRWMDGYSELVKYVEEHKTCKIPQRIVLENGYPLGRWVSKQKGKQGELSPVRKSMLERINGWSWSSKKVKISKK